MAETPQLGYIYLVNDDSPFLRLMAPFHPELLTLATAKVFAAGFCKAKVIFANDFALKGIHRFYWRPEHGGTEVLV